MSYRKYLSSLKLKHIPVMLVLFFLVYKIYFGPTRQLARIVFQNDILNPLLCPRPVMRQSMLKASQTCSTPSPGSSQGCILQPQVPDYLPPTGVTWWDNFCCSFLEEDLTRTNCIVEEDMYNLFGDIIEDGDVVLELGSRYGVVSCALSQAMDNSGKLITVEADPEAWKIHQYNMLSHSCSSYSVFGVMADEDMVVLNSSEHYSKQTSPDPEAVGTRVAHFSWDDIEQETGLTINTLVIDCEGCLFPLIETYKHKFKQIQKILVENDENTEEGLLDLLFFNGCGEKCQAANAFFESQGFHQKMELQALHYHYVFTKEP